VLADVARRAAAERRNSNVAVSFFTHVTSIYKRVVMKIEKQIMHSKRWSFIKEQLKKIAICSLILLSLV